MSETEKGSKMITRADRRMMGKALRQEVPFGDHANWTAGVDRPDPLGLLQAQDKDRIESLLPIKRRLVSKLTRAS